MMQGFVLGKEPNRRKKIRTTLENVNFEPTSSQISPQHYEYQNITRLRDLQDNSAEEGVFAEHGDSDTFCPSIC